jgi:hypothetical protein
MPSTSKTQQRLFGAVHAFQKGRLKHPSQKVKDVAAHIGKTDAKHFAQTKHKGLPEKKAGLIDLAQLNRAVAFLDGLGKAAAERQVPLEQVPQLVKSALARFGSERLGDAQFLEKLAGPGTQGSIPGFRNISDASHWGVPAGQKPGQKPQPQQGAGGGAMSPQQQQEQQDQNFAAQKIPMGPEVKNAGGIAPLPHRYRWDLDETVLRIKRDQVAFAQKKSREAQQVQHSTGVGPTAAGQTGAATQAAPQLAQQHQQQGQQVQQQAKAMESH